MSNNDLKILDVVECLQSDIYNKFFDYITDLKYISYCNNYHYR